jgi:hypothetical protein
MYSFIEQELLTAHETCLFFHDIIYGCDILICYDHKNITYKEMKHTNLCVLCHCIMLDQDYSAKCEHFASELNTGADGLCHFEMTDGVSNDILMENYTINVLNHDINEDFPLAMTLLKAEQSKRNYRRHSENQGTKTTLEQSLSKTPMSTQLMGKLQFL